MAAEAVVEVLLVNLKQLIDEQIDQFTSGEEVVRWIEYEFETLIPQLESVEALSDQNMEHKFSELNNNLRNMIRKAEVLAETYTKRVIQQKAATGNPISSIRIGIISRKLHNIRNKISQARYEVSALVNHPRQGGEQTQSVASYLKRCIHYFVLFPPDFQVPARRLIALWVAEGLIHTKKHDNKFAEQIAQGYLDELIHLGWVHVKPSRSGKTKTCWIDAARRDTLLEEAKEAAIARKASFLQDNDGKILRLVDHNVCEGASFIQIDGEPKDYRSLRDVISFLSFNTQEGSKPGEDIGNFLSKCISADCFMWLNVLDLERVFRPKLPDTLGKLIALKYLGLRWTYLEQLPDSVHKLFNLQVLDVKHSYISVLPRSIWSMEYLRHLYLSEAYRTRFPNPPSKVTLDALQTLWGAFIDKGTCIKQGLDKLLNIRKLGISCRSKRLEANEMADQWKAIDKWISNLKYLETLRLKSRDEDNKASDLLLTSLDGNQNLSTVYLLGKLDSSILCEFPVSLTDITLSGSELNLDPMRFLGMLPNLMILRLLGRSVVQNDKLYCSKRGFYKLKVLWIWLLESLNYFETEEESLPCLEELEIRSCKNLEKLPSRLTQLEHLEVKLTSMPHEFVLREKTNYAEAELVREDDQCILRNTPDTKGKGKKAQL